MSTEAVKWAMDDAPMLLTDKGRPDTTARHVLQALAEHAHKDGGGSHPSVLRIQYRTGYDRRTVQRSLRRLEVGGLITAQGQVNGRTQWKLSLHRVRPKTDWSDLEASEEGERESAAERQRRSRAARVTHSASVTVTHSDDVTEPDVTHSASARHALEMRDVTHSASARHALSAALTTNEPPLEPQGTNPTPPPAAFTPQVVAPGADGGTAKRPHDEDAANAFLEALPAPWTVGRVTARALAPLLAKITAERLWQYDAPLTAELTKNPNGITSYPSVLRTRIEDLPQRLPTRTPATNRPCTACGQIRPNLTDTGICPPCVRGANSGRTLMPADFRKQLRQRPDGETA